MKRLQTGETIIELVLAFAIFSLAAVSTILLINEGLSTTQRNLEITLVREQIDSQAEMLRYLRDTNNTVWQSIISDDSLVGTPASLADSCTPVGSITRGFYVKPTIESTPSATTYSKVDVSTSSYSAASRYAMIDYVDPAEQSQGIWVQVTKAEQSGTATAYDFYIHACWEGEDTDAPMTLGTIVRLYRNDVVSVIPTPSTPTVGPCTTLDDTNLIQNGTFATSAGNGPYVDPAAAFTSELPNRGSDAYPDDDGLYGTTTGYTGGFSLQHGDKLYGTVAFPNSLQGTSFAGDPTWNVPASNTWFYSNPNQRVDQPPGTVTAFSGILWSQTVAVQPNTTYDFSGYFDNLMIQQSQGVNPRIQLRADGAAQTAPIEVPVLPDGYRRVTLTLKTGSAQTSVKLDIYDTANDIQGDDFAMTALALRRCQ